MVYFIPYTSMIVSIFSVRSRCFMLSLFMAISCCNLGHTQDANQDNNPTFLCFNNKVTYIGCDQAYRLNHSGGIYVPSNSTEKFCKGPCFLETKLLLKCIDKLAPNYLFDNKATTQDISNALDSGCNCTDQRGIFDVAACVHGGISYSSRSHFTFRYHALPVTALWLFWLLHHH